MNRFDAVPHRDKVYKVIDHEHSHWHTPPLAVSLYLSSKENAEKIAAILNEEWVKFLNNPS